MMVSTKRSRPRGDERDAKHRRFGVSLRSSVTTWCLAALVVVGGCANLGPGAGPGSGSGSNFGANDAADGATQSARNASGLNASTDNGGSGSEVDSGQPRASRYVLPGMSSDNVALGSIVVTNPVAPRTLDLTARPDDIWDRVRTGFAIPNIDTPLVAQQQAWYLSHPDYLRRAVDRSSLYLFHVVQELNQRGMPTELALLPFVESAYNPMAYSRAHASGMWQFIPGTGRDYNLKQDWWRDERRDVLASTDAALTYLQTIYEMHGDWHLALASYNWGEGSVKRAIERNQAAGLPTDYLSLSMPDETRNYVPRLQALKNIIANPEAFGVTLPHIDNEPYFVAIERSRDIDVSTAARLANMTLEDFRALNPSFNRPVIRASSGTPLLVPAARENAFRNGLAREGPLATWQAHTVVRKESLESIASRYGMTVTALRQVNGLAPKARVRPGQGLLVQKTGPGDVNLQFAAFNPPTDGGVLLTTSIRATPATYVVRRGETLASIASKLGMPASELQAANGMKNTQVKTGQTLQTSRGSVQAIKVGTPAGHHASAGSARLRPSASGKVRSAHVVAKPSKTTALKK